MRAPVTSVKHYVQESLATVLSGAGKNIPIAFAVPVADTNLATEVREGSVIKAVYIEMWIRAGDTAPGSTLVSFVKQTDSQSMTFADSVNLNGYTNKKNIFYHTQGLTNDQDADAISFVRGWFKVPKGKQRMGAGDKLSLMISAQAIDNIICGFMTYKEYF